ncbi:MAG: hypothetical protein QME81_01035 [bacterium]|nr:hypothetical protein [bacterium]
MEWEKDLIVVGADEDILAIVRTIILQRGKSLGIRPVKPDKCDFLKDVLHDSSPPESVTGLLSGYLGTHHRALALRDFEGSGFENRGLDLLEQEIEKALHKSGWDAERVKTIVIEPEVERWLRFDSLHLAQLIRENTRRAGSWNIKEFQAKVVQLVEQRGGQEDLKPVRPKEVFLDILSEYRIPQSASLYSQLAKKESLMGCTVPSFCKLVNTLQMWFPR